MLRPSEIVCVPFQAATSSWTEIVSFFYWKKKALTDIKMDLGSFQTTTNNKKGNSILKVWVELECYRVIQPSTY